MEKYKLINQVLLQSDKFGIFCFSNHIFFLRKLGVNSPKTSYSEIHQFYSKCSGGGLRNPPPPICVGVYSITPTSPPPHPAKWLAPPYNISLWNPWLYYLKKEGKQLMTDLNITWLTFTHSTQWRNTFQWRNNICSIDKILINQYRGCLSTRTCYVGLLLGSSQRNTFYSMNTCLKWIFFWRLESIEDII